jgi:hypothetical protein
VVGIRRAGCAGARLRRQHEPGTAAPRSNRVTACWPAPWFVIYLFVGAVPRRHHAGQQPDAARLRQEVGVAG